MSTTHVSGGTDRNEEQEEEQERLSRMTLADFRALGAAQAI